MDFASSGNVTAFDVMQYLEDHGYAPKGFTELLKQASDIKIDIENGGKVVVSRKERDWEAVKELAEKAFSIIREENIVDETTYRLITGDLKKVKNFLMKTLFSG